MSDTTRPVLRWHGGKWRLAPWIISHFPKHRVYVEPYGGAASVLLRKERSYAEVYNDLDGDVVNLFQVLRNADTASDLKTALDLTPFSRYELSQAYDFDAEGVERARQLVVRSFMGFGSDSHNPRNRQSFRADSNRSGTTPAHDWANYTKALPATVDRFKGVVIEQRPAVDVMARHDGLDTLHYVDPPYAHETRSSDKRYVHEMTNADHAGLLEVLQALQGMVVLSGYPHPMYDDALTGWHRVERKAHADGARQRTEVLWINPHGRQNFLAEQVQGDLLEVTQ